jgi:hypothetical protein
MGTLSGPQTPRLLTHPLTTNPGSTPGHDILYINIPIDFVDFPSVNEIQLLIGAHGFYFTENIVTGFYINIKKH